MAKASAHLQPVEVDEGTLYLRPEVNESWSRELLHQAERQRASCYYTAPHPDGGLVVVKVYRGLWKWRLSRVGRNQATREAEGLLQLQSLGIPTVDLEWFAVGRSRGQDQLGVLVTRRIDAPTIEDAFVATRDFELLRRAVDAMADIHAVGLSHGDPLARNFLDTRPRPTTLDLDCWDRLTRRTLRKDLHRFFGSFAALLHRQERLERMIRLYERRRPASELNVREMVDGALSFCRDRGHTPPTL